VGVQFRILLDLLQDDEPADLDIALPGCVLGQRGAPALLLGWNVILLTLTYRRYVIYLTRSGPVYRVLTYIPYVS
jgi:hypothetical protein